MSYENQHLKINLPIEVAGVHTVCCIFNILFQVCVIFSMFNQLFVNYDLSYGILPSLK